jgi:tRNA threonylcarbamoyladenosine biosynthesis protein TsaE
MMKYRSRGPEETKDIGYRLGMLLKPGDVVGLYGELGAGKTTMVKGIARAFGIDEREVMSASFTIISEYATNPPFAHIDLYRIEGASDFSEVGLWDQLGGEGISVIEWPEKAGGLLPGDMITVMVKSINDSLREIAIEGIDEKNWNNL